MSIGPWHAAFEAWKRTPKLLFFQVEACLGPGHYRETDRVEVIRKPDSESKTPSLIENGFTLLEWKLPFFSSLSFFSRHKIIACFYKHKTRNN